jgi:hypothetical protein
MLAASYEYSPQPKSGGAVISAEYTQMPTTLSVAAVWFKWRALNGLLIITYRSNDNTVSVTMEDMPANTHEVIVMVWSIVNWKIIYEITGANMNILARNCQL